MIYDLIYNLDPKIEFIDKPAGLIELITDAQGKKRPAKYLGKGKYKDITNFGKKLYTSFWRLDGDVKQEKKQGLTIKQRIVKRTYNLKYVIVTERGKCSIEEELFDKVVFDISKCENDLKKYLGLNYLSINAQSYTTDRAKIGKREYFRDFEFNMDYLVLSIDFKIEAEFDLKCLENLCYDI